MNRTTRHSALERLDALVGEWDVRVVLNDRVVGQTTTTFRWTEGNSFLVQRTGEDRPLDDSAPTEWEQHAPDLVTMIIGLDDTHDRFTALYADSRGVYRVYQMTLNDGFWTLWRDAPGFSQRFTGTFNEDGRTINGTWETSSDGSTWEHDFDLIYSAGS